MIKLFKQNWDFQRRLFVMILLLLVVLFITIFVSFNLFIRNFIKADAITQLNVFVKSYSEHIADKGQNENDPLPDISKQPKNRTGTKAEVFSISDQYKIQNFHENEDGSNTYKVEQIAAYLRENKLDLDSINNYHLRAGAQEFYITLIRDQKQEHTFMVFYVDITTISKFTNTINLVLIIIMLIAALISFGIAAIIARSVNQPVKQLTIFARQIGKGDFTRKELTFTDKEFTELANVMNQSAWQLNSYDKEQKTFFQNVSHEFRTPLMSIKCYAEGMECGLMDSVKSSRIIISEVDRLGEMVEDLLYLSRIDNLTQDIEKKKIDLRETFGACAENLKSIADKGNIRLIYDFDECPVFYKYNAKYMYRALSNLISNALRYAKSQIILTCRDRGKTILLSVTDDGDGISTDDLPHIFERFYKGKNGNHGIGLSIVKSVVNLHEGRISVKCDNGTSFLIEFDIK